MFGRRLHAVAGQVGEEFFDRIHRLLVGIHRHVGESGHACQQFPAAKILGVDGLVDRDRGHLGAGDGHDRAFAHHHKIRHGRIPSRRTVTLAEQRRTPRRFTQALILGRVLGNDRAAGGTHAVGHARARGFAEHDQRHAAFGRDLLHMLDFLHVDHRAGGAKHGEIIRHQADFATGDFGEAGDFAVSGGLVFDLGPVAAGETAGFDEGVRIDQIIDALTGIEMTFGFALGELLGPAHAHHFFGSLLVFFDQFFERHSETSCFSTDLGRIWIREA